MSEHTSGPWRYDSGKIWTPRGWWVANVYEDMEEDIKGANGLVLAAAPDPAGEEAPDFGAEG